MSREIAKQSRTELNDESIAKGAMDEEEIRSGEAAASLCRQFLSGTETLELELVYRPI